MKKRFLVSLEAGTAAQQNAITAFFQAKDVPFWHWIDDLWIAADAPEDWTTELLWIELDALPGLKDKTMLVLEIGDNVGYFGRANPEAWKWLAANGFRAP